MRIVFCYSIANIILNPGRFGNKHSITKFLIKFTVINLYSDAMRIMKNSLLILCLLNILPVGISVAFSQKLFLANLPDIEDQRAGFLTYETDAVVQSHGKNLNNSFMLQGENNPAADSNFIGKNHEGGRIFWLDATGKHGLVAATVDQSAKGIAWNPGVAIVTNANADVIYAGQANTDKIISVQGKTAQYAAKLCKDFSTTVNTIVYNDWYLPSRDELNLLFRQRAVIGGFNTSSGIYWSSTETTTKPLIKAWEQEFKFGSQYEDDKYLPDQVRCIRKF